MGEQQDASAARARTRARVQPGRYETALLRTTRRVIDLSLLALALWLATAARFDWVPPAAAIERLVWTLPVIVLGKYLLLRAHRVTSASWRHATLVDIGNLTQALAVAALLLVGARAVGPSLDATGLLGHLTRTPYGVVLMDFVLSLVLLGGVRAIRRSLADTRMAGAVDGPLTPTLLVGAGSGGVAVARALHQRPDLGLKAVGFLDDDHRRRGQTLFRLPVLGDTADLADMIRQHDVGQVLLTVARPPGELVRRISGICRDAGVELRVIPGLSELADGQVNLSRLRPVELEDLLRRAPVTTDTDEIDSLVRGRVVMVTGAGGSIGSELCRQLLTFEPARLVMVERTENALYQIDMELQTLAPAGVLVPAVADITDRQRMREVVMTEGPDVVFHAAAHKHVPMMEHNPGEAVKNNVLGTQTLVDVCVHAGVGRFVLISTDKAVNPTSVMGATKRLAERYVIATAQQEGLAYSAVRFGNVLGSNGSVVPRFRQQLADGGPLTITHPDVKRFCMTIPEAVQLVLQTAVMGTGGEVFVLDMGEQIRIVDLARDLIRLSGLTEGTDVELVYTGLRPGEKLYEELGLDTEEATPTLHDKIFRWEGGTEVARDALQGAFAQLELDPSRPRDSLAALVPEYTPGRHTLIDLDPAAGDLHVADEESRHP